VVLEVALVTVIVFDADVEGLRSGLPEYEAAVP
jgi:hypothetical protein